MNEVALTSDEARVIYTMLNTTWAPMHGYGELQSAMHKLLVLGGGNCCRDCVKLARIPHRLGGMVCPDHDQRPPLSPAVPR